MRMVPLSSRVLILMLEGVKFSFRCLWGCDTHIVCTTRRIFDSRNGRVSWTSSMGLFLEVSYYYNQPIYNISHHRSHA